MVAADHVPDDKAAGVEEEGPHSEASSPGHRVRRKTATLNFLASFSRELSKSFHEDDDECDAVEGVPATPGLMTPPHADPHLPWALRSRAQGRGRTRNTVWGVLIPHQDAYFGLQMKKRGSIRCSPFACRC